MDTLQWLQGGPYLEISFLLELSQEKKQTVLSLIKKLSDLPIHFADPNIDELIEAFGKDNPYDEEAPIHSLELRLETDIAGMRKAMLQVEQLSSNSMMVDFWFFGSQFDAPEWNQLGIKDGEIAHFMDFLANLYSTFEFKAGGIAIEQDIRELFDCDRPSPSECYRFEKLSPKRFFHMNKDFHALLWNEDYGTLQDVPPHHIRIGKSGILVVSSHSCSAF